MHQVRKACLRLCQGAQKQDQPQSMNVIIKRQSIIPYEIKVQNESVLFSISKLIYRICVQPAMIQRNSNACLSVPQPSTPQRRSKRPSIRKYSINCIKKLLIADQMDIHVFVNLYKSFGHDKPNHLLDILLHYLEGIDYFKDLMRLFDKKLLIYILCNGELISLQGKSVFHVRSPSFAIVLHGKIETASNPSVIFEKGQIIKPGQLGCGAINCQNDTYAFVLQGELLLKACSKDFAEIVEFIRFLEEYFFEGIKKMQLQDCWQYVLPFRIISYKPLEKIVEQGSALKGLYIIHSGEVIVQKSSQQNFISKDAEPARSQSCHGFRKTKSPPPSPQLVKSLTRGQFIGLAEVISFTATGNANSLSSEYSVIANSNVDVVMCPVDLVPEMLSNNHYLKSQLEHRSKMYSMRFFKAPSKTVAEQVQQPVEIPENFSLLAFMKNAKKNTKSQISNIKKQFRYKSKHTKKENKNPLDYLFDQDYYNKKHKLRKRLNGPDQASQSGVKDRQWLAYSLDSQTLKRMYSSSGFSRSTKGPVNFQIGFR